ncbi:MAG: type II secretion system F family protein, partial [Planctomycetales bacterium]|nr:type II secretion system F family protein [Planctomycetales bacterium]
MHNICLFALSAGYLIPVAIFIAIAAGVWFLLDLISPKAGRAEERLAEMKHPGRTRDGKQSKSDMMSRFMERAQPLAKSLSPKNEKEVNTLKSRLSHAGFRREGSVQIFLLMRVISLATGIFLSGGFMVLFSGFDRTSLLRGGMIAMGCFFLPDIVVWWVARKRKEAIFLSLPDTLDLMVVCVEAGLGLDQAMRKVAEEMRRAYRVICDEIALCNFQLQMGRPRPEVLHDLGHRTGVDDLRALASILIQAEKFGSSVGQALRVQSDSMRTRRRQLAEEKAAKTAVQLIFPLVLF